MYLQASPPHVTLSDGSLARINGGAVERRSLTGVWVPLCSVGDVYSLARAHASEYRDPEQP